DVRDARGTGGADRKRRPRDVLLEARVDHPRPRPVAADLRKDRCLRAFRSLGAGVPLGADRPRRGAAAGRGGQVRRLAAAGAVADPFTGALAARLSVAAQRRNALVRRKLFLEAADPRGELADPGLQIARARALAWSRLGCEEIAVGCDQFVVHLLWPGSPVE